MIALHDYPIGLIKKQATEMKKGARTRLKVESVGG
jgi:hypothetical protein